MFTLHYSDTIEATPVADKTDRIAQRIASIASAKPLSVPPPPSRPCPKRSEDRRPVYRFGKLTIAGGVIRDCIVIDISANGARIELDGASGLPDYVLLKIVMTGEIRRARVAWRRENMAGLSFLTERKSSFGIFQGAIQTL